MGLFEFKGKFWEIFCGGIVGGYEIFIQFSVDSEIIFQAPEIPSFNVFVDDGVPVYQVHFFWNSVDRMFVFVIGIVEADIIFGKEYG